MPPGFFSLVGLNVFLHMSDPDQASKLPVSSGLIDRSLESLAGKVSFCKNLFLIVQNTDIAHIQFAFIYHVDFLSLPFSFSLTPHHLLSEHKNTLIL